MKEIENRKYRVRMADDDDSQYVYVLNKVTQQEIVYVYTSGNVSVYTNGNIKVTVKT